MSGLRHDPSRLLEPLERRMLALAAEQRFEEAADVRDRAAALARALRRQRQLDGLLTSGRIVIRDRRRGRRRAPRRPADAGLGARRRAHIRRRRPAPWAHPGPRAQLTFASDAAWAPDDDTAAVGTTGPLGPGPPPLELADELACVAAWLDDQAGRVRLIAAERGLTSSFPRLPTYEPRRAAVTMRRGR